MAKDELRAEYLELREKTGVAKLFNRTNEEVFGEELTSGDNGGTLEEDEEDDGGDLEM